MRVKMNRVKSYFWIGWLCIGTSAALAYLVYCNL